MDTWEVALDGRSELLQYGDNRLLLFALALHQAIDDIELVANDVLTDGPNDKKCDLVYVNRESGKVIVGQGYWSRGSADQEAPENKASDLNTAASWLLSSTLEEVPEGLRTAAEQLHLALHDKQVSSIEIWYVHNRTESENVQRELEKVSKTADSLIRAYFPNAQVDSVTVSEVGRNTLDTWYRGTQAPILVTGRFQFETRGGFSTEGRNWIAYSTSVPAQWLWEMFRRRGKNLFSANVRDYLGSRRSDKNIITSAIAAGLETILARPIQSRFKIRFTGHYSIRQSIERWRPVVDVASPLVSRLEPALTSGNLTNREVVRSSIDDFVDMLEAVRTPNAAMFDAFAQHIAKGI